MPTELIWTGTDETRVYVDEEYNVEYHPSEMPHEVPDERVEHYLEQDGWEEPDGEAETTRSIPASAQPEDPEADETDYVEPEVKPDVETFEAGEFISQSWQSVEKAIRNGEADDHLDAVEAAERAREGGPREGSVMEALEERRAELRGE